MTSHHSSVERRAEQFEDLFVLMKSDGLSLKVHIEEDECYLYVVQGDWESHSLLATIEGVKRT